MRAVLATPDGKAAYARRKATVEPVFGQIQLEPTAIVAVAWYGPAVGAGSSSVRLWSNVERAVKPVPTVAVPVLTYPNTSSFASCVCTNPV